MNSVFFFSDCKEWGGPSEAGLCGELTQSLGRDLPYESSVRLSLRYKGESLWRWACSPGPPGKAAAWILSSLDSS